MKVKGQILICTAIMLNDHSNPYIESTTVLSDMHASQSKKRGLSLEEKRKSCWRFSLKRYIRVGLCHLFS